MLESKCCFKVGNGLSVLAIVSKTVEREPANINDLERGLQHTIQVTMATESHSAPLVTNHTPYRLLWLQSLTVLLLRPITHHTGYYGYRVSQCSSCDQSHTIQVTMATESHSAPLATNHTPYRLLWLQSLTVLLLRPITHHTGYYGYRVSQCSSCDQSHTI